MSEPALQTLLHGLDETGFSFTGRIVFINARAHADLRGDITNVQWFHPYAQNLDNNTPRIEDIDAKFDEEIDGAFDALFMLWPKNRIEGEYLFALGLSHLKPGAPFFVAAENKSGGARLHKTTQQFCTSEAQQMSKNKCRLVHGTKGDLNNENIAAAINKGSIQSIDDIGFTSQAGMYGWNKIDAGSQLLLQHIPNNLTGAIADFGCGYGYLLQHILQHNLDIKTAYAIDADARALMCCEHNFQKIASPRRREPTETKAMYPRFHEDASSFDIEYLWTDLTKPQTLPPLDTIIMNPPFHEGKITDSDIGAAFIRTVGNSLKSGGTLYMVANTHLPYEKTLKTVFTSFECLAQDNGFKVLKSVKSVS